VRPECGQPDRVTPSSRSSADCQDVVDGWGSRLRSRVGRYHQYLRGVRCEGLAGRCVVRKLPGVRFSEGLAGPRKSAAGRLWATRVVRVCRGASRFAGQVCIAVVSAVVTGRWRALQHIAASPGEIGGIARAALVLTHFESATSHENF
jgi:hypothetical protein